MQPLARLQRVVGDPLRRARQRDRELWAWREARASLLALGDARPVSRSRSSCCQDRCSPRFASAHQAANADCHPPLSCHPLMVAPCGAPAIRAAATSSRSSLRCTRSTTTLSDGDVDGGEGGAMPPPPQPPLPPNRIAFSPQSRRWRRGVEMMKMMKVVMKQTLRMTTRRIRTLASRWRPRAATSRAFRRAGRSSSPPAGGTRSDVSY